MAKDVPTASQVYLNTASWAWIAVTIIWTLILVGGISFLQYHRKLPGLQIRRLPLVFTGIISLHIYWLAVMLGYVYGPFLLCTAEFWIMSIYLPFGIAMFQLANSIFLDVASRQQQFARFSIQIRDDISVKEQNRWKRFTAKFQRGDKITRMIIWVLVGLFIQFALTVFVFFASRKFHQSYGIFNFEIIDAVKEFRIKCGKGWEWWLSIVWQFFWSWVYAPYILWKSRRIHDVNGWRFQTIACCLAGLPATPLWLAALYSPAFAPANRWMIPPFWIAVSIFFIEIFTIFVPCYQVLKTHNLRLETLEAIASWDRRNQQTDVDDQDSTAKVSSTARVSMLTSAYSKHSLVTNKSDMLTMTALEHALVRNPDPLLKFAALRDFSGENVSFLTHLASWRTSWTLPPGWQVDEGKIGSYQPSDDELRRLQFIKAVVLYSAFISFKWAEFPINISSKTAKDLEVFAPFADLLSRRSSVSSYPTIPFEFKAPSSSVTSVEKDSSVDSQITSLGQTDLSSASSPLGQDMMSLYHLHARTQIPIEFRSTVFDDAEREIKYLILTNTWPKFVNAGYANHTEQRLRTSISKKSRVSVFNKFSATTILSKASRERS